MKVQYDTKIDALYIELRHLEPGTAEARGESYLTFFDYTK